MTAPSGPDVMLDAEAMPGAPAALIEAAVRRTLAAERAKSGEISVALLADSDMLELNRRYLNEDRPTDVLAFALGGADDVVGDVYIGFEQATRQAAELGVPLAEELARLAIHGTLHVLGHDHPDGPERDVSAMFALQERLLRDVLDAREAYGA